MKDYLKIAQILQNSSYFMSAAGIRNVKNDELASILKIVYESDTGDIDRSLLSLYKYHPGTIELSKRWRESNCDMFNENCDCFFPDVAFEDCYCRKQRREKILNHDKRNYSEYLEWRLSVFKRDNFTCRDCGQVGGELNAHHIKGYKKYPKLRIELSNGITLCEKCHRNRHKKR